MIMKNSSKAYGHSYKYLKAVKKTTIFDEMTIRKEMDPIFGIPKTNTSSKWTSERRVHNAPMK